MKLKTFAIHALCFSFVFFPLLALADNHQNQGPTSLTGNEGPDPPISITIPNPIRGAGTIYEFISLVINNIVLPLGGVIAVLYIMYAGFLLVTARGDETQIKDGKRAFTNAAIGTAILLGSWVIASVIETTINQLRAP